LQELKTKFIPKTEELSEKAVSFYINSSFISVTGDWSWNLNTSTIFCSDVIISPPAGFEGTSGIIHPDDAVSVREAVLQNNGRPDHLEFRIITSYGEVKNVVGHNLKIQLAEEETRNGSWHHEAGQH